MLISREWLQSFFDAELPSAAELADALTFHAFEIESVEGDILDVKITPNRGHDCLSYRGIAKEIAAILKLPLKEDPLASAATLEPITDRIAITLENPALSRRYCGGYIKNVKVGPSPEWLVKRLEAMGQKSINNVVDATNFVMFDIGQPLHAFDAARLTEKNGVYRIVVRAARDGETLLALDDKEYTLNPSMLVIADENADAAIGVAGVKGGAPAGISESTKDIVIESANFDGPSVRKTAKALGLRTDASERFQQVISPELAAYGMRAAAALIRELAGGELVGFADAYPQKSETHMIMLPADKPSKVLGTDIAPKVIGDVFDRLGFTYQEKGNTFEVSVPFERLDLRIAEDLIEEIARIVGFDAIPAAEMPASQTPAAINATFATSEALREQLTSEGYSEVFTSVFADTGDVAVLNKVDSVRPYLRANLTDGLIEALKKNVPNKDLLGLKEIKLFEIGTVWKKGEEKIMVGTVSEKHPASEKALSEYAQDTPSEYAPLPLSETERYQPFSRYPSITRDIAMWVPAESSVEKVRETVASHVGPLMIRIDLFDEFKKDDRVSYAFRIVFQSFEKTLTDDEVNAHMQDVYAAAEKEGWVVR